MRWGNKQVVVELETVVSTAPSYVVDTSTWYCAYRYVVSYDFLSPPTLDTKSTQ